MKRTARCGGEKVGEVSLILAERLDAEPSLTCRALRRPLSRSELRCSFPRRLQSTQGRVEARSTPGQTWFSTLKTPKKEVQACCRAEATVSLQVKTCIWRLKIKPLDQTSWAVQIGTTKHLPLTHTVEGTQPHRPLSLFKVVMSLRS